MVYRHALSRQLSIIGGVFYRVLLNRHLEDVFQGFGLLLLGRAQHIGLSECFVFDLLEFIGSQHMVYRRLWFEGLLGVGSVLFGFVGTQHICLLAD